MSSFHLVPVSNLSRETEVIQGSLLDNTCTEVVPIPLPQDSIYLESSQDVPRETALLQSTILGKYEDSIRQHERIHSEKDRLEKDLKEKTEEAKGRV